MDYDVIIVGAGPAGSSAARILEESDYSVALVDKERFPRDKTCAGFLPPRIYPLLDDIPERITERQIDGYHVFSPSGISVKSRFFEKGLTVRRERFDAWLIDRSGAKVLQAMVLSLKRQKDFIKIRCNNDIHKAKIVLGADGVNSVVRRECGIPFSSDVALALQCDISLPESKIDEEIGNWFEVYYVIPYGYGWISPLRNLIKVGVGSIGEDFKKNAKKYLDEFLNRPGINEKLSKGKIIKRESHLIPMSGPLNKLTADRVTLAGDAGGFAYPGTGEGIYYAIKSGRIAAEVIIQALEERRYDSRFLEDLYTRKLEKNGLLSLRDVDFIEKVLSSEEGAERYVKKLKSITRMTDYFPK